MNPIETDLASVFHEVFEDPLIVIRREMTAKDIPAWDSLMHIQLVVAVEKKFGIRFGTGEVEKLQNVGEMMDLIAKKKG
ncbi:MAG: acyl carrier protein [Verrucomicrobiae bacterium]|nr:acyl carrier protein [Verrucomicrobiae bacterium]